MTATQNDRTPRKNEVEATEGGECNEPHVRNAGRRFLLCGRHSGRGRGTTAVTDQELINKLNDAAPAAVLKGATILNMGTDGQMKVIHAPMCADEAGMEWGKAWQAKAPLPQKLGFIYMLRGDNGTGNTDPFAAKETPDNNWSKTGPHVMIVGAEAKSMLQAYPRDAKPDPSKPYVMWPGTPYEHLMLPVK
jgi:hypothetical protein